MSENTTTINYEVEFSGDQHEQEAFMMAINDHGGSVIGSEDAETEA